MNSSLFSYSNIMEISMEIPEIFQSCLEVNLIFEVITAEEQKVSRKQDPFPSSYKEDSHSGGCIP